jgi:uracil-DNA glycosylase family 4
MIVPPDGPLDAKLGVCGEAPGGEEIRFGRGFMGPSGELLWKIVGSCAVNRSEVYVTNVIKERPKNNDISQFIVFRSGRAYPTVEYLMYEQQLYEELKHVKCNVLIAVGAVACYALTRKIGIFKWRGSILSGPDGRKVISTIHTAAALRQYMLTHTISIDIKRAVAESAFPQIRLPVRSFTIRPSYLDCLAFLNMCKQKREVAFDIEVMNEEVSCISFAVSPYEVISIPFTGVGGDYFTPDQEASIWRLIADVLEDATISKSGQNLVFDTTFLFQRYGIRTRCDSYLKDAMVAQGVMYPDLPKGLDFTTSIFTMEPYYKDDGKKWSRLTSTEEDFWIYNAKDSAVVLEILPKIEADLEKLQNTETYDWQRRLIEVLVYMQSRGVKVDYLGMEKASKEAGAKIENLTSLLHAITGVAINPNSPKQVQSYFYDTKGETPYYHRKTHRRTVDKTAMKRLSRKGHGEAKILQEITKIAYNKSHYLDVGLDTDKRLRCSFNPVGTETGRLSSSETIFDTGTNMQNLPEDFRAYMVADKDTMFFNFDLSQAENRIVAYIAPEPTMIKAFEEEIDMHSLTASLILGKPIEEISDEDGSSPIGGGNHSERYWGKKSNHSLDYDLGYKSFALEYETAESEARFIVDRWHEAYPGIRQYHAWVRARLSKDRTLENLFGRKRLFLDRWGDELFKSAYAFVPQSTVADKINRQGLIYIYENQSLFRPVDLLLQVHDSILFQMNYRENSWEQQAKCLVRIKESLETSLMWRGSPFTIPASLSIGFNYHKEKGMREVSPNEFESVERLARCLSTIYGELRASLHI